jgi:hypothetical protein
MNSDSGRVSLKRVRLTQQGWGAPSCWLGRRRWPAGLSGPRAGGGRLGRDQDSAQYTLGK